MHRRSLLPVVRPQRKVAIGYPRLRHPLFRQNFDPRGNLVLRWDHAQTAIYVDKALKVIRLTGVLKYFTISFAILLVSGYF